jgi:hypothetical protein
MSQVGLIPVQVSKIQQIQIMFFLSTQYIVAFPSCTYVGCLAKAENHQCVEELKRVIFLSTGFVTRTI